MGLPGEDAREVNWDCQSRGEIEVWTGVLALRAISLEVDNLPMCVLLKTPSTNGMEYRP